jgi:hypothetical protein
MLRPSCGYWILGGTAPPVIGRERGDAGATEALREYARLHRAVADDAGVVLGAPRNLALARLAPDQRERRLKRIHVTDRLAAREQVDVEIRDPSGPNLPFLASGTWH